jgi:hypothetical protein
MAINFIPNDPLAGSNAPGTRVKTKRRNRPASRASFTVSNPSPEGTFAPGTPGFLFWQCREAGLAALEAWETFAGQLTRWQGNRKKLPLLQDVGVDVNAFYDRDTVSFFHRTIGTKTFFSGASTDVVSHEVGHGLLDSIRPELWTRHFGAGAFRGAFDCTAIPDGAQRSRHPEEVARGTTTTLQVEFRRVDHGRWPTAFGGSGHAQPAEPRHAFNSFQFQIPGPCPTTAVPAS